MTLGDILYRHFGFSCSQEEFEDTNGVIRIRNWKKDIWFSCSQEEFEDTNGVIRIRNWKKDRQHNCKRKRIQNYLAFKYLALNVPDDGYSRNVFIFMCKFIVNQ